MIVYLSFLLVILNSLIIVKSCGNITIVSGRLVNYSQSKKGDSATLVCDDGFVTYSPQLLCNEGSQWVPEPQCHKVNVRFNQTSMIKYLYTIPHDSTDNTLSFSFSAPPTQNSGVLVRLASRKLMDGSRDTLTIELVGGFLATTMQLSSTRQRIIGFCHDNLLLNDNLQHRVLLTRDVTSLTMTVDNRSIQCTYPSGSNTQFTFAALRSIQVGHLQPTWGPQYGFTGCLTDMMVDGLAPLVSAALAENTEIEDQVSVESVKFVESCGDIYKIPTTAPPVKSTVTPPLVPVTGAVVVCGGPPYSDKDPNKMNIIIAVTITLLILLGLIIGVVCKRYHGNKGTYKVDEGRLRADVDCPEQEYFI